MKILILGGTRFVGRHLLNAALARSHQITLFNRGRSSVAAPAGVETIAGDRHGDLSQLEGRRWHAVIDTSGYLPHAVRASAALLAGSVDRYIFLSSLSVYGDFSVAGIDETAPTATLTNDQLDKANEIDTSGQTSAVTYGAVYGALKALCERAVEEASPGRALIVRPGLIVGPHDYTDRFTYWVVRVASGGEVLAPGRPARPVQFIDVRDLAEWIVRMVEREESGVYNANSLPGSVTMETVLEECRAAVDRNASLIWVTDEFLLQENVAPWSEMPLWMPEGGGSHRKGFMLVNCDKALRAGLTFRSLSDTIKDTLTWHTTQRATGELKAGMDPEREQRLLRRWHESR